MTAPSSKHTICHTARSHVTFSLSSHLLKPNSSVITILKSAVTRPDHTAETNSNVIVCRHSFSGSKYKFLTTSLFVTRLRWLESVRVEIPWPGGSPYEVGGFPLGAANPAARQTLHGSFGLPGCGLPCIAQTGPMVSFYLLPSCYLSCPPPHPHLSFSAGK